MADKDREKDAEEQGELPGIETPKDAHLTRLAKAYRGLVRQRMAVGLKEAEKKAQLVAAMGEKGYQAYRDGPVTVLLKPKTGVRVRDEEDVADEDE